MIDIEHLRGWIGREEHASELLTPAQVARFEATFGGDGAVADGDPAPAMIHLCLAPPAVPTSRLGPDGHPARGGFLPPVPLPRRMWAGGEMRFEAPIRVGEVVARRSVIRDVVLKQGRSGPLCFVTVDHAITSGGRPVLAERQDIVYREAEAPGQAAPAPAAPPPAPEGNWREVVRPSPPLLFRYSALTFNSHRIHYDAPYAREVEGYPGLVVHGPLQATLLVRLAAAIRGRAPAEFGFRSLSPLHDDADVVLHAAEAGDGGLRLWTARPGGPVAMEGLARW